MAASERDHVQLPLTRATAVAHNLSSWDGASLPRTTHSDILIRPWLTAAITELNPGVGHRAVADAVRQLERILAATTPYALVERAREFLTALRAGIQVRVRGRLRALAVIDFDNPEANRWDIATEVTYSGTQASRAVRFDIVLYCNGIPLVVIETKSMTDPKVSWLDAADDLAGIYSKRAPAFLAAGLLQIATDGREVRYGGVRTPAEHFQRWGTTGTDRPDEGTWEQTVYDFCALTDPARVLSWARDLVLHVTDKASGSLTRIVPRWPQAEAVPLLVERSLTPGRNRGLLEHYQGSGKTYAMLMAANTILRIDPGHCVVLVVDRLELLRQHLGDFSTADGRRSVHEAETSADLFALLATAGTSGFVVTTVQRFRAAAALTQRCDVTVMVDEAHRSHEGVLGQDMRQALPNATLLGLTGTPVVASDRNTYLAFGDPDDPGYVLHRYGADHSVADGTTVPLVIDRRQIVQPLDRVALDEAYAAYIAREGISATDAETLAASMTRWDMLLKDSRRMERVADDVVNELTTILAPDGYGALLVVADREACVAYAELLSAVLGPGRATAVISGAKNDPVSFEPYVRSPAGEEGVKRAFRDPTDPLKLLVVTSKLIIGFDARNCHTVYIDKPMKEHTLFQAATRANRTWTTPAGVPKGFGRVVDYCGIADELEACFSPKRGGVRKEVVRPEELVELFIATLDQAEHLLGPDFDWSSPAFIFEAKAELARHEQLLVLFRQHVQRAELIYETVPNHLADPTVRERFTRLLQVLHSYGDSDDVARKLLVLVHGPAVRQLVEAHTGGVTETKLPMVDLTVERIRALGGGAIDPAGTVEFVQYDKVMEDLRERLRRRLSGAHAAAYRSIAEKLERFAGTEYVDSVEGAREAVEALVRLATELKAVDDRIGVQWQEAELELYGRLRGPAPAAALNDPKRALQSILDQYHPKHAPAGVDDVAKSIDRVVEVLSYRSMREDPSTQKLLIKNLTMEAKRLGILPTSADQARQFVDALVDYVNLWLI